MNKKISIGIAGAGVFGGHHASKYATHDQAALTGVYDPDVVRAEQLAGRFGATAYGDYADFLSKTDAVVIAAPAICHFDLASAALKAGLHVFVEKPLALHVDDADKLIELADANQVILQVGHQERYVLEAAGLFSRDRAPVKIDCVRRGKESGRCEDVSVAFDLMIHDLDIIRHLTDSEVTKVNANGDAHEASAQLVLANGAVASLNASRRAPALERRMTLVFDDGVVEIDFVSREISNTTPAEFDLEFQSASAGKAASDPLGFGADQFISAILSGNEPIVSGRHGRIAVDWARRVESALTGVDMQGEQREGVLA